MPTSNGSARRFLGRRPYVVDNLLSLARYTTVVANNINWDQARMMASQALSSADTARNVANNALSSAAMPANKALSTTATRLYENHRKVTKNARNTRINGWSAAKSVAKKMWQNHKKAVQNARKIRRNVMNKAMVSKGMRSAVVEPEMMKDEGIQGIHAPMLKTDCDSSPGTCDLIALSSPSATSDEELLHSDTFWSSGPMTSAVSNVMLTLPAAPPFVTDIEAMDIPYHPVPNSTKIFEYNKSLVTDLDRNLHIPFMGISTEPAKHSGMYDKTDVFLLLVGIICSIAAVGIWGYVFRVYYGNWDFRRRGRSQSKRRAQATTKNTTNDDTFYGPLRSDLTELVFGTNYDPVAFDTITESPLWTLVIGSNDGLVSIDPFTAPDPVQIELHVPQTVNATFAHATLSLYITLEEWNRPVNYLNFQSLTSLALRAGGLFNPINAVVLLKHTRNLQALNLQDMTGTKHLLKDIIGKNLVPLLEFLRLDNVKDVSYKDIMGFVEHKDLLSLLPHHGPQVHCLNKLVINGTCGSLSKEKISELCECVADTEGDRERLIVPLKDYVVRRVAIASMSKIYCTEGLGGLLRLLTEVWA